MQALIIGADHLGQIPRTLETFGISVGHHLSGRHPSHQRLPHDLKGMDVVILLTDFINHNAMRNYRQEAQRRQVRCIFCRRNSTELQIRLEQMGLKNRDITWESGKRLH